MQFASSSIVFVCFNVSCENTLICDFFSRVKVYNQNHHWDCGGNLANTNAVKKKDKIVFTKNGKENESK